jgi:hypothetical protein
MRLPLARATADGLTATLRHVGDRRFRLQLSYDHAPGFARVFLAFSLRHLAELLARHVPPAGVRTIAGAVARAWVV